MGNAESQPEQLPTGTAHALAQAHAAAALRDEQRAGSPANALAFHVLRVADNSPAADAGIEPFFDFVCGVNGAPLGDDIDALTTALEDHEDDHVRLQVYSSKRRAVRDVDVVPSRSWSSTTGSHEQAHAHAHDHEHEHGEHEHDEEDNASESGPSLLGLSLRLCSPRHALDQVWHVLEILEGSPAESAGLVPFGDWIIGYAGGILRGEGDFYDVVETHAGRPLRLFVYNADYDVTREAILVPNRAWGGAGLLGCGIGYGLLHRIPQPRSNPPPGPPPRARAPASQQQTPVPMRKRAALHADEDEDDVQEEAVAIPTDAPIEVVDFGAVSAKAVSPPPPPPPMSSIASPPRASLETNGHGGDGYEDAEAYVPADVPGDEQMTSPRRAPRRAYA